MSGLPVRASKNGLTIVFRLTPKSARDGIDGIRADSSGATHIAARVRAVPDKGAANAALEKLVAGWLGVPASSVAVTAGHTARLKSVTVRGDPAMLEKTVVARLS